MTTSSITILINENKVLRVKADDSDALRAKLFLLLQTEQYMPALDLIKSLSNSAPHDFEKAYALYGLHRENEARENVSSIKNAAGTGAAPRGVLLLEAQLVS